MSRTVHRFVCGLLLFGSLLTASFAEAQTVLPQWKHYTLKAKRAWQLNPPQGRRFDASGLLLTPDGSLLAVNDRGASLYRIAFRAGEDAADLVLLPDLFSPARLAALAGQKAGRYDCEGIARDDQGRLYLCEEGDRWVLRCDPATKRVERLHIDWAPVQRSFSQFDRNASFEGIAVGNGKLYLANERNTARIIVVDLASLTVVDDFEVVPPSINAFFVTYSDLSWFDGALFVLMRESYVVLKVDPTTHKVLAEYDYNQMENAPSVAYYKQYPIGTMEGLAVDRDFIWLVTDNNGQGRLQSPEDKRPTLFKCPRPDRVVPPRISH